MLRLMQLQFRTVHSEPCEKEPLLDHWCKMIEQATILSLHMLNYEVNSIYQRQDSLTPPPPPYEFIGLAETPEITQVCTRCQPGETKDETFFLLPKTPYRLLLLSKWREVLVVPSIYDGRWRGSVWFGSFNWHVPSKNKIRSEFRVLVRVHSVLRFIGSCGNQLQKQV